ncbi:MAG: hypothetical protein ABIS03_03120 [Gemmatimonadaceae bacterium]
MSDFIARQNSERLRQRLSGGFKIREPPAFARLARSLVEMAVVTGVVARVFRMVVLNRAVSPMHAAIAILFGALFILLMASLHLSRVSLRSWLWRAPAFAAVEGAVEMLVSLGLIGAGREPLGTGAAHFHDWPGMALGTLAWRIVVISVFALLLAAVVKWVRFIILRSEHAAWSDGTVKAGVPGEGFIERRGSRTPSDDSLLFKRRRHHDNKRG